MTCPQRSACHPASGTATSSRSARLGKHIEQHFGAALVTDAGGLLSHGAIVSREYGLPAVVGTTIGTTEIRTGDRLRVDGTEGKVTILERGA